WRQRPRYAGARSGDGRSHLFRPRRSLGRSFPRGIRPNRPRVTREPDPVAPTPSGPRESRPTAPTTLRRSPPIQGWSQARHRLLEGVTSHDLIESLLLLWLAVPRIRILVGRAVQAPGNAI